MATCDNIIIIKETMATCGCSFTSLPWFLMCSLTFDCDVPYKDNYRLLYHLVWYSFDISYGDKILIGYQIIPFQYVIKFLNYIDRGNTTLYNVNNPYIKGVDSRNAIGYFTKTIRLSFQL